MYSICTHTSTCTCNVTLSLPKRVKPLKSPAIFSPAVSVNNYQYNYIY